MPAPKKRARKAKPTAEEDAAQEILRAIRRAPVNRSKKQVERFNIADPPESVKRKATVDPLDERPMRPRRRVR